MECKPQTNLVCLIRQIIIQQKKEKKMLNEIITRLPFLTVQNVLIYVLIINLFGFLIMFIDKKKAEHGAWRIPEKTLLITTMLGGWIGTYSGMKLFHHKTQKPRFSIGIPVIAIVEIVAIIYILIA